MIKRKVEIKAIGEDGQDTIAEAYSEWDKDTKYIFVFKGTRFAPHDLKNWARDLSKAFDIKAVALDIPEGADLEIYEIKNGVEAAVDRLKERQDESKTG